MKALNVKNEIAYEDMLLLEKRGRELRNKVLAELFTGLIEKVLTPFNKLTKSDIHVRFHTRKRVSH